ncbi:hypothetical protein NKH28_33255 [Mesorhizobium sp. M1227]|uniref:hypothetical protein n=1 Tax=Mesorhizobium sp. M1227 TaxID=2957071 RepID=UPI00333CE91F
MHGEARVGRSGERGGVGVAPSQLYAWRKQMAGHEIEADRAVATFARIEVNDLPRLSVPSPIARTRPAGSS